MTKFQPFYHQEIEAKRKLLETARKHFDRANDSEEEIDNALACALSSALIYMNHADYLAQWFARSVQETANIGVKKYYQRQISIKPTNIKDITIGDSISIIKEYDFAGREELLKLLQDIKRARNHIAHTMVKVTQDKWSEIDTIIIDLRNLTEELINFTDEFKKGMPPKSMDD